MAARNPLRTVQRWVACNIFPERKHRVYPSIVDEHGSYLEKRYREGCRKIMQLWQELKERGFDGAKLAATPVRVSQECIGSASVKRSPPLHLSGSHG